MSSQVLKTFQSMDPPLIWLLPWSMRIPKRIDDEISKPACVTGLRVLVISRSFKDAEIMEKIRQTQEEYGPQESNFLVLILPEYFKWNEPFEKLRALLFDPKGRVIGFGSAEGYIGASEICAFKDVSWTGSSA